MEFLDREDELALLDDHLKRPGASLFVLYGRRRIGKTSLLSRALDSVPRAAYHVGTRSTVTEELGRLSRTLDEAWDVPVLRAQPLGSFEALLGLLEGVKEHSVLVLDEFPYLVESEPALPGLLQASWDRRLSRRDVKLVVCGSSVSVMESTFLSPRAPLYGRRARGWRRSVPAVPGAPGHRPPSHRRPTAAPGPRRCRPPRLWPCTPGSPSWRGGCDGLRRCSAPP